MGATVHSSKGSRRFPAFLISLAVLTIHAATAMAIAKEVTPELVLATSWPIVALAAGYLGFTNWHDRGVRQAELAASSPAPSLGSTEAAA